MIALALYVMGKADYENRLNDAELDDLKELNS